MVVGICIFIYLLTKVDVYKRQKHNRAKPMSESVSALFSIADAGEFRFARFYIVCEEVPLGTPESPPIVSGMRTCTRRIVQTWKRHGIRCKHLAGRNAHIFLQRISICIPSEIEGHGLFRILLLSSKGDCLLQVGSPFFFALFYDRRKKESYFFGQVIELDIAGKEAWLWRSSKYSRCI